MSSTRSSHQRCSMKKGILRNFTKLAGKHLCQSLFFNKVLCLRPASLLKKRIWHRCFPANFAKFLITPFLQNTSGRQLLFNQVSLQSLPSDYNQKKVQVFIIIWRYYCKASELHKDDVVAPYDKVDRSAAAVCRELNTIMLVEELTRLKLD